MAIRTTKEKQNLRQQLQKNGYRKKRLLQRLLQNRQKRTQLQLKKTTEKTTARKTAAKKTAEKSASAKKPAVKRTAAKKTASVNAEVYVQFWGKEVYAKDIVESVKKIWTDEMGKKRIRAERPESIH